jgi:hypothetical protein
LTRFERLNKVENIVSLYIVFCGGLEKETSTAPKALGCQNRPCSRPRVFRRTIHESLFSR